MAAQSEQKGVGYSFYYTLLYELKIRKDKSPEIYSEIEGLVDNLRTQLSNIYGIDNLPPVPKQDDK
ncbi:MAG: hypothetical protein LBN42_02790 [Oscillospiraceae bacterium]|jgi:hypothetical protein|nr:hypothetical protein [Oscillospiraceae bacterium]